MNSKPFPKTAKGIEIGNFWSPMVKPMRLEDGLQQSITGVKETFQNTFAQLYAHRLQVLLISALPFGLHLYFLEYFSRKFGMGYSNAPGPKNLSFGPRHIK